MKSKVHLSAIALSILMAGASHNALGQQTNATTTTVSDVTGTISQLNYSNGEVDGFLIGTNTLLSFSGGICGGVSTLGAAGNSVTYSGNAVTSSSGFESVQVTSFANNTTKATYTAPASPSTAYGPTSGTVKQLNYGGDGLVNGFLFAASGSSSVIFVSTGPTSTTTLLSVLTVGVTVSVTGTTSANMSACASSGALESVNASSLTIGSTTVVFSSVGPGNGGHFGGPGPH